MGTDFREDLNDFIVRIAKIRALSSPQLTDIKTAGDYSHTLKDNFNAIGNLAGQNRQMLDESLYPILDSVKPLDSETVIALQDFCENLMDADAIEDLDLSLLFRVSNRLLQDALAKGDDNYIIEQLDLQILACYAQLNQVKRIKVTPVLTDFYQKEGLKASRLMLGYLDKSHFAKLTSDKSKDYVLVNSRYFCALYENTYIDPDANEESFEHLKHSHELSLDPFYLEQAPEYDWYYHRIRVLEYMGQMTECGNVRGCTPELCHEIAKYVDLLVKTWDENPEIANLILPVQQLDLNVARAAYYDNRINVSEYRKRLKDIYETRMPEEYSSNAIFVNLLIPLEYIMTLIPEEVAEEDIAFLQKIYHQVLRYVFRAPHNAFFHLLDYFSEFILHYIEVPGEMTFEEMGLQCMAAVHPPTYVHSMQVAQITRCLCSHLIRRHPQQLLGILGYETVSDIRQNSAEILNFAYHAALCHDFGKIPMIDTIFVYGRNLLDSEYETIRMHPDMGAELLSYHNSTKDYTHVARGHHRWFDNSAGYPADSDTTNCPDKPIIDVVSVADSLDAATDRIGRSYSVGKTLQEILSELRAGSGTRYAPNVVALFEDEAVRRDIEFILQSSRSSAYQKTYLLLKEVTEKGELE